MTEKITEIFTLTSNYFSSILAKNSQKWVERVALVYFADLVAENKAIAAAYVELLLNTDSLLRVEALESKNFDDEEKFFVENNWSLKYKQCI